MGWNLQGVIAYLVGIALPFPGFVGTLGANVSETADQLGHLGWLLSFSVSFVVYVSISYSMVFRRHAVLMSCPYANTHAVPHMPRMANPKSENHP